MWAGAVVMLLSFVAGGAGVVLTSWPVVAAAAVAFLVGVGLGWRGGIMYDVHGGGSLEEEIEEVKEGEPHRGTEPGETRDERPLRESAASATAAKRERLVRAEGVSAPWRPAAATVMLFLAAWLLFGQFFLHYPYDEIGQDTQQRHTGVAIVLSLSAMFLRQMGPSKVASGVVAACGLALIASAIWLPHHAIGSLLTAWVVGVLVLVGAVATLKD